MHSNGRLGPRDPGFQDGASRGPTIKSLHSSSHLTFAAPGRHVLGTSTMPSLSVHHLFSFCPYHAVRPPKRQALKSGKCISPCFVVLPTPSCTDSRLLRHMSQHMCPPSISRLTFGSFTYTCVWFMPFEPPTV